MYNSNSNINSNDNNNSNRNNNNNNNNTHNNHHYLHQHSENNNNSFEHPWAPIQCQYTCPPLYNIANQCRIDIFECANCLDTAAGLRK